MPPLRDRVDDVLRIATRFLADTAEEEGKTFEGFAPDVEVALTAYAWPGNVHELQNCIRNVVVLNAGPLVTRAMLPQAVQDGTDETAAMPNGPDQPAKPLASEVNGAAVAGDLAQQIRPLGQVERETIESAIALCGGSILKAAQYLSVSPSTLYRKQAGWERRSGSADC